MRANFWWLIAGWAFVVLVVATVVLAVWQPALPGQWCPARSVWLVCYRDWLVPIAGFAAAAAAGALVLHERHQARGQETQQHYAARMALASQLEDIARGWDKTIEDVENWHASDGHAGERHIALSPPPFTSDYTTISALPPDESEALTRLAKDVLAANEYAAALFEYTSDMEEAEASITISAAEFILRAMDWNQRFSSAIGWTPMHFDPARKRALQKMVQNDRTKYEKDVRSNEDAAVPSP